MVVLRVSEPVHFSPHDGQFPSGYEATSSGVSTRFSHVTHFTTSVEDEGCHMEPFGITMIVSVMVCLP